MSRKNAYILFIAILLLHSCGNTCKEDKTFKDTFFRNIMLAEQLRHYNDSIWIVYDSIYATGGIDALVAHSNMSNIDETTREEQEARRFEGTFEGISYNAGVTGIDLVLQREGGPLFCKNTDSIILAWKNWYEENKCAITMKKADSLYFECCESWDIAYEIFEAEMAKNRKKNLHYIRNEDSISVIIDSVRQSRR